MVSQLEEKIIAVPKKKGHVSRKKSNTGTLITLYKLSYLLMNRKKDLLALTKAIELSS